MKKLVLLLMLLFSTILLTAVVMMKADKKALIDNQLSVPKNQVVDQIRGTLKLLPTSATTVNIGDTFTFNLIGNSKNYLITGYDLVLLYDKDKVSFKERKNMLEDFSIYDQQKPGQFIVTGMSKPTTQTKISFKDTPLLQLTFQAVATGQAEFKISWEKNSKKESNLISDNSQEVLDLVQGTTINIGKKVTLRKNQPIKLEDGVEVTLVDVTSATPECFDCISSAEISVTKNNQKKNFVFKIGGLAGLMITEFSEFNYSYYLENINSNEVDLIILKK